MVRYAGAGAGAAARATASRAMVAGADRRRWRSSRMPDRQPEKTFTYVGMNDQHRADQRGGAR